MPSYATTPAPRIGQQNAAADRPKPRGRCCQISRIHNAGRTSVHLSDATERPDSEPRHVDKMASADSLRTARSHRNLSAPVRALKADEPACTPGSPGGCAGMSRGVRQVGWAPRDRWNFAVLPGPGRVGGGGVAWAQTALMCTRCVPSGSSIGPRAGSPPSGCERPCAWLFTPDRRPRRPRSVRAARTAEARRRGSAPGCRPVSHGAHDSEPSPYQGLLPDACSGANWRGRRSPPHGLQ